MMMYIKKFKEYKMKYSLALLSSTALLLSLNAAEVAQPVGENEFPYIQPIAVEQIQETKQVQQPQKIEKAAPVVAKKAPEVPAMVKVDSAGVPVSATLRLNFDFNKYDIKPKDQKDVNIFAQFLKDNTQYKAVIVGHTDSIGSYESNQILSENRAASVRKALINDGVAASRLSALGKGEKMPIADNMNEAGRAENRRIEIELKSIDK